MNSAVAMFGYLWDSQSVHMNLNDWRKILDGDLYQGITVDK